MRYPHINIPVIALHSPTFNNRAIPPFYRYTLPFDVTLYLVNGNSPSFPTEPLNNHKTPKKTKKYQFFPISPLVRSKETPKSPFEIEHFMNICV